MVMKKIVIFTTALFFVTIGFSFNNIQIKSFFVKTVMGDETTARVIINKADKQVKFQTKSVFNEQTAARLNRVLQDLGHSYVDNVRFIEDNCIIQFNSIPDEDKLLDVVQEVVSHLNFVDFVVVNE